MSTGIPALLTKTVKNTAVSLLGVAASSLWNYLTKHTSWGVYKAGTQSFSDSLVVTVDSIVETSATSPSQVSDYKVESGSFASYNKVQKPMEVMLRMSRGGSDSDRKEFLNWLKNEKGSTSLFDVLWPEGALRNVTLSTYSISRTAKQGVTIIYADCTFAEVREITFKYYNSSTGKVDTSNASAASAKPTTAATRVQSSALDAVTSGIKKANSALKGVWS